MNKDQFYKQIEQPKLLSQEDIQSLQELVEQYPYFASARVLLAKALHSANDHRFDDALQVAAVFAGDRKVLYSLMMKERLTKQIEQVDRAVSADLDTETGIEEEPESKVQPTEIVEETPLQEPDQEAEEEDEPASDETERSVEKPAEEEKVRVDQKNESTKREAEIEEESSSAEDSEFERKKTYDEYEQEILYEAINSSISKEVSEDQEEEEEERKEEKAETPHQHEAETEAQKQVPVTQKSPSSYSQWLRRRASEIHYYEEEGSEEKGVGSSGDSEKSQHSESDAEGSENKPRQDELIEKFIESEPKITPRKADMFSSDNLAKMSVVEDESFVTETMAKIFARQGNIRKAKRAYKLLSLKYPEKSIYFANQIKKLQGKK